MRQFLQSDYNKYKYKRAALKAGVRNPEARNKSRELQQLAHSFYTLL